MGLVVKISATPVTLNLLEGDNVCTFNHICYSLEIVIPILSKTVLDIVAN